LSVLFLSFGTYRKVSASWLGIGIQLYTIYVIFSRLAWCPSEPNTADLLSALTPTNDSITNNSTDPPSWTISSYFTLGSLSSLPFRLLFNSNLSLLPFTNSCPTRPPTFHQLCLTLQLTYYIISLLAKLQPTQPTFEPLEKFITIHLLHLLNGSVWLPLFLTPTLPPTFTLIPGLNNPSQILPAPSFWGSWIFGGLSKSIIPFLGFIGGGAYWGPIFFWTLHLYCFRTLQGIWSWEHKEKLSELDEVENKRDAADDEEGSMGGWGGWRGWYYRMWCRFSPFLVVWVWEVLYRDGGILADEYGILQKFGKSVFGSKEIRKLGEGLEKDGILESQLWLTTDLNQWAGLIWVTIGVVVPSFCLTVWLNFVNYQHKLVLWEERDSSRSTKKKVEKEKGGKDGDRVWKYKRGIVVDDFDGQIKVGILY
jgi:hypothetical protein